MSKLLDKIPVYMHDGLIRYINDHIEPGGFLRAVLENNLKEACARADSTNQQTLFHYVNFLYNEAPRSCWGSPEKVSRWLGNNPNKGVTIDDCPF